VEHLLKKNGLPQPSIAETEFEENNIDYLREVTSFFPEHLHGREELYVPYLLCCCCRWSLFLPFSFL